MFVHIKRKTKDTAVKNLENKSSQIFKYNYFLKHMEITWQWRLKVWQTEKITIVCFVIQGKYSYVKKQQQRIVLQVKCSYIRHNIFVLTWLKIGGSLSRSLSSTGELFSLMFRCISSFQMSYVERSHLAFSPQKVYTSTLYMCIQKTKSSHFTLNFTKALLEWCITVQETQIQNDVFFIVA